MALAAAFWTAVVLMTAPYTLYPLMLAVLGRLRPVKIKDGGEPSATVVVPAHNEEKVIAARIENVLSLDYPPEKLRLVVVLDGCNDRTEEIARGYEGERVLVLSRQRRGKMSVLNEAVARTDSEVIVFSDAEWTWRPDAMRKLLAPFGDERVGCVCGSVRYIPACNSGDSGEGLYMRFETFLKRLERRFGAVFVASGANYALRRELYRPLRADLSDDFVLPSLAAAAGKLVVFAEGAIAEGKPTLKAKELFLQKRRIIVQGLQGMVVHIKDIASAGFLRLAQAFLHKGLRWFGPVLLAVMYVSSVLLIKRPFYLVALVAQTVFYGAGMAGLLMWGRGPRILRLPAYFCLINGAAAAALWVVLCGGQSPAWEKAETAR